MALVVEDGSGLSTAESYLSVDDADVYHAAHGNPVAWSGATTSAKETALRLATQYLDVVYPRWLGGKVRREQALQWPRSNAEDKESDDSGVSVDYGGWGAWPLIPITEIPVRLKHATAELALRSIAGALMPDLADSGSVASESVSVGSISTSISYLGGRPAEQRFRIVDALVAPLQGGGGDLERA